MRARLGLSAFDGFAFGADLVQLIFLSQGNEIWRGDSKRDPNRTQRKSDEKGAAGIISFPTDDPCRNCSASKPKADGEYGDDDDYKTHSILVESDWQINASGKH